MNQIEQMQDAIRATMREIEHADTSGQPMTATHVMLRDDSETLMRAMRVFDMVAVDQMTDHISLTTVGRAFAGIRPEGVPDLTVERVLEVTGNITESALASDYIDSKITGCERLSRQASSEQAKADLDRIAMVADQLVALGLCPAGPNHHLRSGEFGYHL